MTARVIRGGDAPSPSPLKTSARRIDGARFAARIEAEMTIAAARAEAEAIAERARSEGMQRGVVEGLAVLAKLEREASDLAARATDLVLTAARAVAERAIGHALATDDRVLHSWTREALAAFAGARRIRLHANEATLRRLSGLPEVELVLDNDLADFVLLVRTELGEARVELGTQVASFVESIRDVLGIEVAKR